MKKSFVVYFSHLHHKKIVNFEEYNFFDKVIESYVFWLKNNKNSKSYCKIEGNLL